MDSNETDAPVWSRPHHDDDAAASHEAYDPAAAEAADDDVIVIESHETGSTGSDAPAETDHDQPADAPPVPAATIWSAGTSGPAVAEDDPMAPDVEAAAPVMAPDEPAITPAVTTSVTPAASGGTDRDTQRWSEIKAMFVDDPGESVKLASGLVERAMENLMASLRQRQESLGSWESGDATGTEELRNTLRGYRNLFDKLDGLSGQFRSGRDRVSG